MTHPPKLLPGTETSLWVRVTEKNGNVFLGRMRNDLVALSEKETLMVVPTGTQRFQAYPKTELVSVEVRGVLGAHKLIRSAHERTKR